MSLSPLTFTGVSKFSSDFQTILNRTVAIASQPVQLLQNQQKDLLQQKLLVSNLSGGVAGLATAVENLGQTAKGRALAASSSNTSKVTATNVSLAAPATFTISNITSVAKAAAETSVSGYANTNAAAVSSTGSVKLVVGSQEYSIDISSSNNLTALRDAINASGAPVTASVLTTGNGATPYYLSLTANETGATTLELRDDPSGANTNLLTANNQGANSVFELNGVPVSKKTTFINDVVPGLTLDIKATTTGTETVTVAVNSDRSALASDLDAFVSAYNNVRQQVNDQIGQSAGLLSGDFLVREVQTRLRGLTSFAGTGAIKGLADLGVEFSTTGEASFDSTALTNLSASDLEEAFDFLGTPDSGFGGLSQSLTDISDSVIGMARIQLDKYDETDKRLTAQIAEQTTRISAMQISMASRLQMADSLLASLESQQNVLDAQITALNTMLYGKQS
ncbi:MAG: flagellar filament capping protein FliD [Bryobacterales bacterium]|nr:flagellar filament capping protein FliD [Bryobacterales bacterium]